MSTIALALPQSDSQRVQYGVDLLVAALRDTGHDVAVDASVPDLTDRSREGLLVLVAVRDEGPIADLEQHEVLLYNTGAPGQDGYYLSMLPGRLLVVTGGNDSGVLYGCQELVRILRDRGEIPRDLDRGETPDMVLRGPAIGLQKTTVEPPRQVYEYPVTPERFPWFYDRELWIELLDRLFDERANVIYLWSGHPFSSFVRLADYPEAQEVTDAELERNTELLHWLTTEANRRGIWVVLKFYNIHIPLPFAEHHGIPLRQTRPTPLVSDYTRQSIAAFVAGYPHVGLFVCLGEALQGDIYGADWLIETILAGVHDGVTRAQLRELPPIILRAHALDLAPVLDRAEPLYPRLFTEAKYNGESLTTWNPRGAWQQTHRELSGRSSIHIVNVHILANLEPFRYGAVGFIQRSVQAMKHRLDADGLHLYPLFYWEWPLSPDRVEPRLRQLDRDWLWYAAWHRYAWKADRDPGAERAYWTARLGEQFGGPVAGEAVLDAYEAMGQIAPMLVRRIGITEGNRQTLSLGMTMSQLTNAERHRPWADLWESHAPQGERLPTYVRRELAGQPHVGETPLDVVEGAQHFAQRALRALGAGESAVTADHGEYQRLRADAQALALLADFYALRVEAAVEIMAYREELTGGAPQSLDRLETALVKINSSVDRYRELADLTDRTYLYANSMQTPQRKVPFADGGRFDHWRQCLPQYEAEALNFAANLSQLAEEGDRPRASLAGAADRFREVPYRATGDGAESFTVQPGASVFNDTMGHARTVADELVGLSGVRLGKAQGFAGPLSVELSLEEPGHVLIGYFQDKDPVWLQVPDLEVDTHADVRGGLEPVLRNGVQVDFHPRLDVHALRYDAGTHELSPGRGAFVIIGVVAADTEFSGRDASARGDRHEDLDWLYEER